MTAVAERLSLSPEFVARNHLQGIGYGYALGRIAGGDVCTEGTDAIDFGDYYADRHARALDIDELYAEFIEALSEKDDSQ